MAWADRSLITPASNASKTSGKVLATVLAHSTKYLALAGESCRARPSSVANHSSVLSSAIKRSCSAWVCLMMRSHSIKRAIFCSIPAIIPPTQDRTRHSNGYETLAGQQLPAFDDERRGDE